MKGTKGLFWLGMVALALTFMVLAGCKTDSDDSGSGTKGDEQQGDTTKDISITIRNDTSSTEAAAIIGVGVRDELAKKDLLGGSQSPRTYDTTKTAAVGASMTFTITPEKSGNSHYCHIYVSVEGSTESAPVAELRGTSSAYTLKLSSRPNTYPRYTLQKE